MSEIIFNPPKVKDINASGLQSQIENLQTTLASLNQQVIFLQEAIQEKDQEIARLQAKLADTNLIVSSCKASPCEAKVKKIGETVTIIGALISLYKFAFSPGKEVSAPSGT